MARMRARPHCAASTHRWKQSRCALACAATLPCLPPTLPPPSRPPVGRLGPPPGFASPLGPPLPPGPPLPGFLLPPSVRDHILDIMHQTQGALRPEDFEPPPREMLVSVGGGRAMCVG